MLTAFFGPERALSWDARAREEACVGTQQAVVLGERANGAAITGPMHGEVGLSAVPTINTLRPAAARTPLKLAAGKSFKHESGVEPRPGVLLRIVASWRLGDPKVEFRLTWDPPHDNDVAQTEMVLLFRSPETRAVLGSPHYVGIIANGTWDVPHGGLGFDPCHEPWELEVLFLPVARS
jgi:hypothetical protein